MNQSSGPIPGPRSGSLPPSQAPPSPAPPPGPLQQLIQSQIGNQRGDATAYLKGAAHLDRAFRDAVIEELAEQAHRIPPPSFGIDLVAVLKECFAARDRAAIRAAVLLVVPVFAAPIDVWGALLPLLLVLGLGLSLLVTRKVTQALERLAARFKDPDAIRWIRRFSIVIWLVGVSSVVVPMAGLVGGLVTGAFSGGGCQTDPFTGQSVCPQGADFDADPLWALLITVGGWSVVAAYDRYRTLSLLQQLATGRAESRPEGTGRRAARYQEIRQQQADPDVVYSDYAPFVGAGVEMDHWSFAIELVEDATARAAEASGEKPALTKASDATARNAAFTAPVVHERMRQALIRLGETEPSAAYPGDRLHGLTVDDYVFKSGKRVGPARDWNGTGPGTAFAMMAPHAWREASEWLRLGPDDHVPATWWADSVDLAAEERLRHYLAVRVGSWAEEVVLTVFTRVQLQGGLLFVENRAFLLPPIARAYHAIDTTMPPEGLGDWFSLGLRSLYVQFGLVASAIPDLFRLVGTAVKRARTARWYARMCAAYRPVDHGPRCSVRELGAESEFQQLFQEMDVQRFLKSVATRTLTAVKSCLQEHGYYTGEYDARRNVVINNGVLVHGDVTGNVQSGANARATFQQVAAPQPRIGSQPSD